VIEASDVAVVILRDGDVSGRGEATGVIYHGETLDSLRAQIASVAARLEDGLERQDLQTSLPRGAPATRSTARSEVSDARRSVPVGHVPARRHSRSSSIGGSGVPRGLRARVGL
jgi:hypothetical protein